jgi:hypothetical protein
MTMHGPMSQGPVHNSWKLKMSQFSHDLHIQQIRTAIEEWDNITQATINSLINFM